MSKIRIYYFSGTGNTAYVVDKLKRKLESIGNKVTVNSCEENVNVDNDYDLVGIVFPIYSSFSPSIFAELLNQLPTVIDKPLFGIVTSGYIAGDVLHNEGCKLVKKGYKPFLYRNIVVGNNLHLPFLSPLKVTSQKKLDKRRLRINNQINDIALKIHTQDRDMRGNNLAGKVFGITQRKIGIIHEKLNFKGFNVDSSCSKCKWCINNCPTNNIHMSDEHIIFDNRCMLCMRCYNFCPENAIQSTCRTKNFEKYRRYSGPEGLGCKTLYILK